jgi:hypothetical protein
MCCCIQRLGEAKASEEDGFVSPGMQGKGQNQVPIILMVLKIFWLGQFSHTLQYVY